MDKRVIPVVFAADDGYVKQLATTICSILMNSEKDVKYDFNIMTTSISQKNQKIISSMDRHGVEADFHFIDMKEHIAKFDLRKFMSVRDDYNYITTETYFRFFIPDVFPQYEKVLYLDADIVVLQNLVELFDTDIENHCMGVVQDTVLEVFVEDEGPKTMTEPHVTFKEYFKNKLKKKNTRYFNAGILLMNLEFIRQHNLVEKLWRFAQEESPLEYQDQDIFNAVMEDCVKYVDYKWNVVKDLDKYARKITDADKREYLLQTYDTPGIFHYVGSNKPWLLHNNYSYKHVKDWWVYYQLTPYFSDSDKDLLTKVCKRAKLYKYKEYLVFRVWGFSLLEIYRENAMFRFNILGVKTRIKL